MLVAQLAANAVALAAAYALVALGFMLVVNATRAVNFAHGELVMAGGFMAVALAPFLPLPGVLLLPVVMAGMAGLGLLVAAVAVLPLRRGPPVSMFISTIAVGMILHHSVNAWFGAAPRSGPALAGGGVVELAGLVLPRQSLAMIVVAVLLVAALHLLLNGTQLGRRMRAAAQDPEMARAVGIRVGRMVAITFALAAALAGAAGLLLANQYFVTPAEGGVLILKAYIAVTIGGWGSLPGAVAGAAIIALSEVVLSAWLSYAVAEAVLYLGLLALLAVRPQGLFGEAVQRRP